MSHYIRSAFSIVADGFFAFAECFRPSRSEPDIRPVSIDRYFSHVGGFLINARNRFEREYMEGQHAGV